MSDHFSPNTNTLPRHNWPHCAPITPVPTKMTLGRSSTWLFPAMDIIGSYQKLTPTTSPSAYATWAWDSLSWVMLT